MTLVNLTPHTLNIVLDESTTIALAPSGTVARCAVARCWSVSDRSCTRRGSTLAWMVARGLTFCGR